MIPTTEIALENMTLNVQLEIHVKASLETTFEALLEQLGPGFENDAGTSMAAKIEPWPGGRWYRDLGDKNGHWWGNVQAIKRPTLLEISGPLFLSAPVVSNLQYRLSKTQGGTLIAFRHTAMGLIPDEFRKGVGGGWKSVHQRIKKGAEARATRTTQV